MKILKTLGFGGSLGSGWIPFVIITVALSFLCGCASVDQRLGEAAVVGNASKIQSLIAKNPSAQARSAALIGASEKGCLECVKTLLDAGANVNYQEDASLTTQSGPFSSGGGYIVTLDTRSEPNAGRTPLIAAIKGRHVEVVKLLLERGASVNARFAETPYLGMSNFGPVRRRNIKQLADESGNAEIVRLILAATEKTNAK